MKGFMIYEDYGEKVVEAVKLGVVNYTCKSEDNDWVSELSGIRKGATQAYCNRDDTYDFEVGALIALMKMCGVEKVKKAAKETFFDVAENSVNKYEEKMHALEKEVKHLKEKNAEIINGNSALKYIKSCNESTIESLENTRDLLINKNNELIEEKEKLQHDYDLCKNSENASKCSVHYLNKTIAKLNTAIYGYKEDLNKVAERCKELEEENEKLKLDCEKLQHGYNDMIFCGGRQNGKQYTALVNMFKKLDQKKVDAAYKEAYGDKVIWCTSQLSIRDTVDSLIEENRAFTRKCVEEWLYGPPTKREEMWENILNASQDPPVDIKVAKQDIKTFLKELQDHIPKARWNGSDCLLTEYTNPYWFNHDYIYFALFRKDDKGYIKTCYDENKHSWIDKPVIEYIAPMRWDLFKKGRLVVKVDGDNYEDFYNKCEIEIGRKPSTRYSGTFTVYYKYEKELEEYIFHTRPFKDTIPFAKKVVNWEDVR